MNDTQITDDLLEELEELESSSVQMDKQVNDTQAKKAKLDKLDSPSAIDATSLALEAAKTSQEAADQSQKAAEASLSHANRQKKQVMELSDANFSWRQAVKSANKELKSAKSRFAIMLSVSIITSLITMSVMGWLLYSMHKKEAAFKGEILDILQTENALLTKQITIKVDELSALIELMTADIQKINKMGMAIQANTSNQASMPANDQPVAPSKDVTETKDAIMPIIDLASEADPKKQTQENLPTEAAPEAETQKPAPEAKPEPMVEKVHTSNVTMDSSLTDTHYAEIKQLIEKILSEQHKLQATTLAPQATSSAAGLTAKQDKQLKDISWLVRKQAKTLEQIKKTISQQPAAQNSKQPTVSNRQAQQTYKAIQGSLIELKDQLGKLQAQQNQLQSQVDGLQKETKILSDAAKPYSYQIKQ